jgi:dephospho-CoA kinase
MLTIAVTGGIGSGKTQAAQLFSYYGVTIIDSDVLSREVTALGTPAYQAIVARYTKSILSSEAIIDRKKLRQIIFNAPHEKIWLENLLHPLIQQARQEKIQKANSPYALCIIPLLVESGLSAQFDRILVIDLPYELQLKRALARDHHQTAAEMEAIIKAQASREQRLIVANDVIFNDHTLDHLAVQVAAYHGYYSMLSDSE